jgi:hypothetical protein
LFSVALISTVLLLVSIPQNIAGEEHLTEWGISEGVRENTTAYATDLGGPSLEFYMDNGFIEQPTQDLVTGMGKLQIDAYILMGSATNTLNISWDIGTNNAIIVTINGNTSVEINQVNYDSTKGFFSWISLIGIGFDNFNFSFKCNTWQQLRIIKESSNTDNCTVTVIVGANMFTETISSGFNGGIKIQGTGNIVKESTVLNRSVFMDNIDIQYTPTTLEVAAGWYDTIIYHEYFPVGMVAVFGLLAVAVVKGVFV